VPYLLYKKKILYKDHCNPGQAQYLHTIQKYKYLIIVIKASEREKTRTCLEERRKEFGYREKRKNQ